jgi:hypothetical protein
MHFDAPFWIRVFAPLTACLSVLAKRPTIRLASRLALFTSRRHNQVGLCFPPVSDWPNFIYEVCILHSVLNRELTGPHDWQLLSLECMRLVDMAHYWAIGTHDTYKAKLTVLRNFEDPATILDERQRVLLQPC